MKKAILSCIILLLFSLTFISAQQYYYFPTPSEALKDPYVMFAIFFILFFAVIYFSLGKSFKGNVAIPAVIAAALAFLIAAGIQQQWQFLQQPIIFWAVIIGIIMIIVVFFFAVSSHLGIAGGLLVLSGLWAFSPLLLQYAPRSFIDSNVIDWFSQTAWLGVILFIIMLFYLAWRLHGIYRNRWRFGY